ncbi:YlmC/YmxH family sporulation protein [Lederbergia graminis]|uniref:YlmC/YmxH family sporulation protein n=1 Tax=Lederbergia graminis TaxID=735518 RepID=A0ABW0LCV8_9BACI
MRLSELGGKEIVDYNKAKRLGVLGQTDLEIDTKTGAINHLIIPSGKWMGRKGINEIKVPWHFIRTIGTDMIILEVPENNTY